MIKELKPCPFCGGKAKRDSDFTYAKFTGAVLHFIRCEGCGNRSQPELSWDKTIKKWNRRVGDAE